LLLDQVRTYLLQTIHVNTTSKLAFM
jgi:hypothetical protein